MTADAAPAAPTVHASAVRVGDAAVLIRGPSGAGKSRLAFELILAGRAGVIAPTLLIGDDRLHLAVRDGALFARPAAALEGLIEIRGLGIRRCDFAADGRIALIVDLAALDAARLPTEAASWTTIEGVKLPRLAVGAGYAALPLVIAALTLAI